MKIERYEACKDSDITWLGSIPTNWNTKRLQDLSHEIGDGLHGTPKYVDSSPYYFINGNNLSNGRIQITDSAKCISKDEYQQYKVKLDSNSILLSINGTIGNLAFYGGELIALGKSAAYIRIKPNFNKIFIYFFLQSEVINTFFNTTFVGTTIRNLSLRTIRTTIIPVPSLEEQAAIAYYLDTKTAQIDRKIDLLTQKATLYSNLKQSLINEAVTCGLDKTAPMKNSGIDAIGEVPTHWTISRIKNLGILSRGVDLPREDFVEGIFPVYGSNGIIGYHSNYTTKAPCLTVGRSGSVGEINYVSEDFWAHNTALYLQQSFNSSIKFIFYLFKSLNLQSFSAGSAVGTLNRNIVHQLKIAIPPASEQKAIADYLDIKTAQIDQIIQTINTQIEKLKELRKTLINDVVTGKIKVTDNGY